MAGIFSHFVGEMLCFRLMDLREYQQNFAQIGFGKKLPTAVYVYRADGEHDFRTELAALLAQLVTAFQVGPEFNAVKFRTNELKISFLGYPRFFEDSHPALRHAITIDLVRGKARQTDYADNPAGVHRCQNDAYRHRSCVPKPVCRASRAYEAADVHAAPGKN
jgi:hypothetical protein